jgi:hypothetical protein
MAVCPKCEWNVNTAHMVKDAMACPHCRTPLRFNWNEYRRAAGPGFFVAMAVIFNLFLTADPIPRGIISAALLVAWLVFFRQYKRYLRSATLEVNQRVDAGQDI